MATIIVEKNSAVNNFVFTSRAKTVLLGFIVLGLVCLIASIFVDATPGADHYHTRFWSNWLHNSVFFTGLAFMGIFVLTAFTLAYAGWYVVFKRIWEAFAMNLVPSMGFLLLLIVGIWAHWHHLYHWTDTSILDPTSPDYDAVLEHKSSFLNKYWYTFGTLIFVGFWTFVAFKYRQLSLREDEAGDRYYEEHKRTKFWSAIFLPIAGFSSAALIWQWVMSVDAHWYSTLFAWYSTASWFVAAMAVTILLLVYLKGRGYYPQVTGEHIHDLGKYLFAIIVFWTYLWFSQYMLIWYGNVGEETVYFYERYDNYPVIFYANLAINFLVPFIILMRNDNKRKNGTLVFTSVVVLFGHWLDFFLMIKPGTYITALEAAEHEAGGGHDDGHGGQELSSPTTDALEAAGAEVAEAGHGFVDGFTMPGFLEIGIGLGFLAFFVYLVLHNLSKAPLVPEKDPYLGESLHHHVGYGGGHEVAHH